MFYLNRLRPQLPPHTTKASATKETFTENAEPQQEHLKLLADNEKYRSNVIKMNC